MENKNLIPYDYRALITWGVIASFLFTFSQTLLSYSLVFGIVFYLLFNKINIHICKSIFVQGSYIKPFLSVILANIFLLFLYAKRISSLFPDVLFKASVSISSIGHIANNCLPFRLGELVRIFTAKKFFSVSYPKIIILTIFERAFDLMAIFLIGMTIVYLGYNNIFLESINQSFYDKI